MTFLPSLFYLKHWMPQPMIAPPRVPDHKAEELNLREFRRFRLEDVHNVYSSYDISRPKLDLVLAARSIAVIQDLLDAEVPIPAENRIVVNELSQEMSAMIIQCLPSANELHYDYGPGILGDTMSFLYRQISRSWHSLDVRGTDNGK